MFFPRTLFFALALAPLAHAVNPPAPFARSPYVQFASPTMMHVAWRTEGPVEPVVRFGKDPTNLDKEVRGAGIVARASLATKGPPIPARWEPLRTVENLALPKLHSAPVGTFQYEARLKDLEPETTYYYAVFDGGKRLTPASVCPPAATNASTIPRSPPIRNPNP